MSMAVPEQTMQGYSTPRVRQFSVFLDNKVGKLLELLEVFDESSSAHLCAFSVHESSDYAVVRIVPSNADAARVLLRDHGLPFAEYELLIVELCEYQTLTRMCLYLLGAELSIRFAYPLMLGQHDAPTIALAVDDPELAGQILRKKNFRLLGEGDLP